MKKIIALLMVLSILFLTGCKKEEEPPVTESISTAPTTQVTTTQKVEPVYYNFLTGEKRKSATTPRPVAVTINNISTSLPQYGISEADIIMEFPAEGGITRLIALYSDYSNMPNVCSIRSCRYYFPIFAQGFGAVYFCYGSNETLGTPTLKRIGIDYIDGNKVGDSLVFARDQDRLQYYSLEHTAYLKGENMSEIFKKYEFDTKLSEEYGDSAFSFSKTKIVHNDACKELTAIFSNYYESRFTYDEKQGVYLKEHNGDAHMDGKSNKQLAFENVIILETDVANYNGKSIIELDWTGGTGYYATKGTIRTLTWSKASEASPVCLFDENGKILNLNIGKSYIGVGTSDVILPEPEVADTTAA